MISLRKCIVFSTTLAAAGILSAADEKPVPQGSIRPQSAVAPAELPALAKIDFGNALQAALAAAPGRAIEGELEVEDGTLVFSFEIVGADKTVTEVEVDAGTGKILAADKESAEGKEKEEKADSKKEKGKHGKKKDRHDEENGGKHEKD